jgi:hypothetical protein
VTTVTPRRFSNGAISGVWSSGAKTGIAAFITRRFIAPSPAHVNTNRTSGNDESRRTNAFPFAPMRPLLNTLSIFSQYNADSRPFVDNAQWTAVGVNTLLTTSCDYSAAKL